MTIKNTLKATGLVAILALSNTSCRGPKHTFYDGTIGENSVVFWEKEGIGIVWDKSILTVTKPNGQKIIYSDYNGSDLKLDEVEVTDNTNKTITYYRGTSFANSIIEEYQRDFDMYLAEIKSRTHVK